VRDGPAEGAGPGRLDVDVDPLVVAGGVGELVDPLLGHLHPLGAAEVRAGARLELVETVDDQCHVHTSVIGTGWPGGPPSGS
jgi:hypothetical protein